MILKKLQLFLGMFATSILFSIAIPASACTTVLVGKKASTDGSTIIARNEDSRTAWTKRFVVHPHTDNGQTNYVSKGNQFSITLPAIQQRYTATPDWTNKDGTFGEDGINESNVAMSGTESATSNKKAIKADPFIKNGISEDAMLDTVLPFIKSAREGVSRLGQIINEKGAAEPEGIIFSDKNDIWYFEIGAGHQWAAVRIPDNKYAVIPNQLMIGKLNLKDSQNFLASSGIVSFVKTHHLNGYHDGTINFAAAFGTNDKTDAQYNRPRVWDGQRYLTPSKKQSITQKHFSMLMTPDHKISISTVGKVLSLHFNDTKYDSTGKWVNHYRPINVPTNMESHIIQFRQNVPDKISGIQWLAMASPDTSVYIPFYTDINNTPSQYQIGTDSYDNQSAYWTYKLTKTLVNPYYNEFVKKYVRPAQQNVNNALQINLEESDQKVRSINDSTLLTNFLTQENQQNADLAQKVFNNLNKTLIDQSTAKTPIYQNPNL